MKPNTADQAELGSCIGCINLAYCVMNQLILVHLIWLGMGVSF